MKLFILLIISLSSTLIYSNDKKDEPKAIWIDVRTNAEWNQGHLPEAIHIPYKEIGEKISKLTKDKKTLIKLYCKSGGRAGIAKKTLEKLGYKNVRNAGGYEQIIKDRR